LISPTISQSSAILKRRFTYFYSDSGDESMESGSDEDSVLSGTFINDGTYTQHDSQGGAATQYGMYLAVNNYHTHMRSPDDFVRGKLNVAGLVRRRPLCLASPSQGPGTGIHSSSSCDVSILPDTPELDRSCDTITQEEQEGTARGSSGDESTENEEEEPIKPVGGRKTSLLAQLTKGPQHASSSASLHVPKKFVLSGGKENNTKKTSSAGKATFFSKLALKGLSGDSSDDSDGELASKPVAGKLPVTSRSSSRRKVAGISAASSSVNRTPLLTLSPNKVISATKPVGSPSFCEWDF
jgi:hypothetical protein